MKKNYFNLESPFAKKIGSICCIILLILFFLLGSKANAQVSITKPNLTVTACSGFPTAYNALGDIVIDETSNSNISTGTNKTLVLSAPTNFEFQAGTGSVSYVSGKNISAATIAVTATTITITYTCGGTNRTDSMTISGLQVRGVNTASTGDITRSSSSTGTISGISTGTTFTNTLTSVNATSPSQATGFTAGTITSTSFPATFSGTADGYLVIRSAVNTPPSQPVDGTTYSSANIATLGSSLTFVQSSSSTSIAGTSLTGNKKFYYFIYAYKLCSGSPIYNTSGPLTGSGTTCPGTPKSVTPSGITANSFSLDWAYPIGGNSNAITYIVQITTDSGYTTNIPGSPFTIADPTTTLNVSGLNPTTTYYYRILADNGCSSSYVSGSVTTLSNPCVAPTSPATGLTLGTLTSTAVPATFTGAADGYLVIYSTEAVEPIQPTDGILYNSANIATLGTDLLFMQSGSSTTIAGAGLTGNTKYYIYIYSYTSNGGCSGGPVYNTAGPLTGSAITCPSVPLTVTTTGITQNDFTINWVTPAGGSEATINYTVEVTTDAAFTTPILDSPFTITDPNTSLEINDLYANTTYYYRILANNGCSSNYVTGTVTTLSTPCDAPTNQAFSFTNGAITSSTYPATFLGSADGFLVIRSTSATPPSQPVDGIIYNDSNITTLGTGLTFVQTGSSYNIASTGLNGNTKYYYYVYAYTSSSLCTGSPAYNTSGPLVGSGTTCPTAPSPITTSGVTATTFTLNWTTPTGGTSNAITYKIQITTNAGFTNNIPGSPFTVADPTTTLSVSGLTAGTTYYYRVLASNGCDSSYTTGSITTSITNDDCANAIALTVNPSVTCVTSTSGTTIGATQSATGCQGTADDDVWYKFTAAATQHTITVTPSTLTDAVFQVYNASCGGISFGCINSTSSTSPESISISGLTAGTTYYIRVYSYGNGNSYRGNFEICVTTPVAPVNNDCSGAIALTVNSTTTCITSTNGTTQYATQSQTGCSGTADDDVWYSFVATNTSHKVTVSPITLSNAVFQVFSGSCSGLTSLQCTNATSGSAIEASTVTGLTVGATYYVRVYASASGSGAGTFSICVTTPCSSGNGTGTSTTQCPSIIAGATGLNGADPTPITCFATNKCTNLEAIYTDYRETTSYSVSSIPYAPPYQFNCLANPISVNVDDVWSPTINLPFNFCYYGNTYNKVLIGSNGVITFDTTTNTPGGYSDWSFSNNLPSTSLFLNSIFGVYHDIDPSKGGQVGWELVTLDSGCRALVAAWSDIPMYSTVCNNSLYTGMIVLHENSNIIDVFIKEKNACSSWNGGNAVVGIQNANGTQAVVAPNRNSTDADWTVNYEAWRFSPSGASVASVKWYQGAGTSGPVVGTTSNVSVCPTATTTYTSEVTYAFCNGTTAKYTDQTTVTISSGKTWTGAVSTDWSDAANWSPNGVPTNQDCITIPNVTNKPVISGTSYNAYAYNLTVAGGSSLTAQSQNNITVTDYVKVNTGGSFNLNDSASLIQINNTATNTGSISMKRTAYVKAYDYVYWCSPVKSFNSGNISPTSPSGYVFKWNPTIANSNGGQGNWVAGTESMVAAKGYIAISPGNYSYTVAAPLTATFTGVPYNGIRKPTISRGSYTGANYIGNNGATITNLDDNWNLIGNPYPSAINALSFLTLNTNINGNIRLWTHGSPISSSNANPFYGSYTNNYDVNDYISYNGTGSTPPGFNGKIAAGQAFFVVMNDGSASSSTVTFNNSMRSAAYDNSQFYKSNSNTVSAEPEKNRIWLSLVDANNAAATTLVGYVEGATYEEDRLFDASHKIATNLALYSWINDKTVIINGRPTPFDDNDYVNLGATVPSNGTYSIGINQIDGLFTNDSQDIFLEDTQLNVIHNLRTAPYTFTAAAGNYADRFILRYKNSTLSNSEHETVTTFAYIANDMLHIKSDDTIKQLYLYDVSGKLINKFKPTVESNLFEIEFPYQNGVYLVTVVKSSGEKVTVKLLK
ncbi:fibronectin type III domain-containing protein [Flavobacterium sp. XGLA_31]|uniref:fibronectin type III domain-containing protein n=1 Tax=Flavobacterium sp. XGLA_31 TaxID=3447666 RepID=UPI003F371E4D